MFRGSLPPLWKRAITILRNLGNQYSRPISVLQAPSQKKLPKQRTIANFHSSLLINHIQPRIPSQQTAATTGIYFGTQNCNLRFQPSNLSSIPPFTKIHLSGSARKATHIICVPGRCSGKAWNVRRCFHPSPIHHLILTISRCGSCFSTT